MIAFLPCYYETENVKNRYQRRTYICAMHTLLQICSSTTYKQKKINCCILKRQVLCSTQIHTISGVAEYLKLENPRNCIRTSRIVLTKWQKTINWKNWVYPISNDRAWTKAFFATMLVQHGDDLFTLKKYKGWRPSNITEDI